VTFTGRKDVNQATKDRFSALVEEKEFHALVELCKTVMKTNESLYMENAKLKREKVPLLKYLHNLWCETDMEKLLGFCCITLLIAIGLSILVFANIRVIIPAEPTGKYYIGSCSDGMQWAVREMVNWGDDHFVTPCLDGDEGKKRVQEVLRELTNGRKETDGTALQSIPAN